jgi:hypothetical protein
MLVNTTRLFCTRRSFPPCTFRTRRETSADLLFVQMIDVEKLPGNSAKLDQCRKLLEIVPSSLSTTERRLRYTIHYGTVEMFRDRSEQSVLLDDIAEHLSVVEPVAG